MHWLVPVRPKNTTQHSIWERDGDLDDVESIANFWSL
jgi:hypothetical protein